MDKKLRNDIVEWDVQNWSRAIDFWKLPNDLRGKKVLDIGGRNGGLSLLFALMGANVVCSDINIHGFEKAKALHERYGVSDRIAYKQMDATALNTESEYDIITYKSVWGAVGYDNHFDRQEIMARNIYRALKADGTLYFCENLTGSLLHRFLRNRFISWGNSREMSYKAWIGALCILLLMLID